MYEPKGSGLKEEGQDKSSKSTEKLIREFGKSLGSEMSKSQRAVRSSQKAIAIAGAIAESGSLAGLRSKATGAKQLGGPGGG